MQLKKREYEVKVIVEAENLDAIDELMDEIAECIDATSSVELGAILAGVLKGEDV